MYVQLKNKIGSKNPNQESLGLSYLLEPGLMAPHHRILMCAN
jgi:hypothetical protein